MRSRAIFWLKIIVYKRINPDQTPWFKIKASFFFHFFDDARNRVFAHLNPTRGLIPFSFFRPGALLYQQNFFVLFDDCSDSNKRLCKNSLGHVYVPICQLERYLFCSSVNSSISILIASSFSMAIWRSTSSGSA